MTIAMPAMTAKAANRLPLTPKRKPLSPDLDRAAICPLSRLRYLEVFPRAAVSRYPVNKFGTGRAFAAFLTADCLPLLDFFREPENDGQKQKAGVKAGLPQFAVECAQ
jgi:mono/diheme cytochrome c family protein